MYIFFLNFVGIKVFVFLSIELVFLFLYLKVYDVLITLYL